MDIERAKETVLLPESTLSEMIEALKRIYEEHGDMEINVTGAYGSRDFINSLYVENKEIKPVLLLQSEIMSG